MSTTTKQMAIAATAIVVGAALLRFYGIDWGLPQVYEEATPVRKAWGMWGWGEKSFDPNPHFFNYPSLTIYIQLVGQGLLYVAMKVGGVIESSLDFRLRYVLEKTPFFLLGRIITALFAIATVWLVLRLGCRIGGLLGGVAAGVLLAVNSLHIAKSQVTEVDIPLTFFVVLALSQAVAIAGAPRLRHYVMAGVALGLAASTKYTGAALAVPLVIAHVLGWRAARPQEGAEVTSTSRVSWKWLAAAGALAFTAFFATSPYVFLDFAGFRADLLLERDHMRMGHFGQGAAPTWWFYGHRLLTGILGWPIVLASLVSLVCFVWKRRAWAIVLASFVLPYVAGVTSWQMRAERYLLPALPVLILFAGIGLAALFRSSPVARLSPSARAGLATVALVLLASRGLASLPAHFERLRPDTRTEAKRWIEENIPAGSFVAIEHHGPELLGSLDLWTQEPDVRERIIDRAGDVSIYAVQRVPMFQMGPERSEAFYDISLYDVADIFITSGAVESRYRRDPERFERQISFYDTLETNFTKIKEFLPNGATGPTITIYKSDRHDAPFSARTDLPGPRALRPRGDVPSGEEPTFYFHLGLNYETFKHYPQAIASYTEALRFPFIDPAMYWSVTLGITRVLMGVGQYEHAAEFLDRALGGAPTPDIANKIRELRKQLRIR